MTYSTNKADIALRIEQAIDHHRAGRLAEAEAIYRGVLAEDSQHLDALHMLGVLRYQNSEHDEALSLLRRAWQISPGSVEVMTHLANVLEALERRDEAIKLLQRIIALQPAYALAHYNLGNAYMRDNRLKDAVQCFRKALHIDPGYFDAYHNMAFCQDMMRQYTAAEHSIQRALELRPDDKDALTLHARISGMAGNYEGAMRIYRRLLELDPTDAVAAHMYRAYTGDNTETEQQAIGYVRGIFDDMAGRFEDLLVNSLGYRTPAVVRSIVDAHAGHNARFENVLDLGCGTGLSGEVFQDICGRMIGIDISQKMLDIAREKGIYDELQSVAIGDYLHGVEQRFDLVVACDVLVYFGDLLDLIGSVMQRLAAGGLFVFTVEDLEHGDYAVRKTGRFAHSAEYIGTLCGRVGGRLLGSQQVPLRKEMGVWLKGGVYLLTGADAPASLPPSA